MNFLTKIELEKTNILNLKYNKSAVIAIIYWLKKQDDNSSGLYYEPITKKNIQFFRSKIFLNCWSVFFKELNPLLKHLPINKRFEFIHLIYGNAVKPVEGLLFHWPHLFNHVAIPYIEEQLDLHKKIIKHNISYKML